MSQNKLMCFSSSDDKLFTGLLGFSLEKSRVVNLHDGNLISF